MSIGVVFFSFSEDADGGLHNTAKIFRALDTRRALGHESSLELNPLPFLLTAAWGQQLVYMLDREVWNRVSNSVPAPRTLLHVVSPMVFGADGQVLGNLRYIADCEDTPPNALMRLRSASRRYSNRPDIAGYLVEAV